MPTIHVEVADDGLDVESYTDIDRDLDERYRALVEVPRVPTAFDAPTDHGLPARVVVGDRSYDVRVFVAGTDAWSQILGSIDHHFRLLSVRAGRPQNERRETLLHELLHAVDDAAGTGAGEPVVNAWAPVLLDALRRNPDLTTLLLAEDQT